MLLLSSRINLNCRWWLLVAVGGTRSEHTRYFKMKVGSPDPQEDVLRARAIREEIGEDNFLMMDANQKW